jgi:hypothetical protein
MALPSDDAAVLSARWTEGVILKRDVFSTVERGRFKSDAGEVDAVLRRLDQVPVWSYLLARHLFARERRALALARDLDVGPKLLWAGRRALVRGFIDGVALHLANPTAISAISAPPSRLCENCIAPAFATTTLPRNRTGCAAAMGRPISPIFSWRHASKPAAGCSASQPTRICGIY